MITRQLFESRKWNMDAMKIFILITLLSVLIGIVQCYRPVIIIHGILDHAYDLNDLKELIQASRPGTNVTLVGIYEEIHSFTALWKQIEGFTAKIRPIMEEATDGVHIIGFSQGGLVARGIIETMQDHNVINFISLSAPLMGQYGDSSYLKPYLPKVTVKDLYKFFYTPFAQSSFSVANYWNDPFHQEKNLAENIFLPVINNNKSSFKYNQEECEQRKKNFLRLENLILIGGPDDGVITPWQSSQFGSYQEFTNNITLSMEEQEFFKEDSFGLKTLSDTKRIHSYTFSGVKHVTWHGNKEVYDKAIEPWLT